MRRAARFLVQVVLFAGLMSMPERPQALPCVESQPTFHQLSGWFEGCLDTTPASAFAFLLSNPDEVNSAAVDFICEDSSALTSQGRACQMEAGSPGDNRVTLFLTWSSPGPVGCPNPSGSPGARIQVHTVVAQGRSIVMNLGYSVDLAAYAVEAAQPWDDVAGPLPLSCSDPARRFITVNQTGLVGGQAVVDLTLTAPPVASDCDAGTLGDLHLGTCPQGPSEIPLRTPGRVYTRESDCSGTGDLRTSSWTFRGDSDAQGHAQVTFPPPPSGSCVLLGATYRMDGQEVPAIAGFVVIPADIACVDEICDGIDNDCDGQTDEDLGVITCGRGRCTRTLPACVDGVEQICTPPGPPSRGRFAPEVCGRPGIGFEPVP